MKLSEKRTSALYSAISDPIFDERLHTARSLLSDSNKAHIDKRLYDLEQEIWRKVKLALDLEDPQ